MTTPERILLDLLISDATPDSLAERIRLPMLALKAMCQRHEADGLVTSHPIANSTLTAYRITSAGREITHNLQTRKSA
jgi:hypothetical protein